LGAALAISILDAGGGFLTWWIVVTVLGIGIALVVLFSRSQGRAWLLVLAGLTPLIYILAHLDPNLWLSWSALNAYPDFYYIPPVGTGLLVGVVSGVLLIGGGLLAGLI
jgi:hypothetical protein